MRAIRGGDGAGFTLVEITVTLAILGILVLSMSVALASGLRYLTSAKQRGAAVQAASAIVERAHAVAEHSFTELGLVPADVNVATDPNLSTGTCGSQSATMFAGEPVMTAGTTSTNPLYPHVTTATVGQTVVTLKAYVTGVTVGGGCSTTNPTYKRVTVLGTWAKSQKGTSNQVRLATYLFNVGGSPLKVGAGCTSNCGQTGCTFNCGGTGGGSGAGCTSNCTVSSCGSSCSLTSCTANCNIAGCANNCTITNCTSSCTITSGGTSGNGCSSNCTITACANDCTISGGGGGSCSSNCSITGCATNCTTNGCSSNCTITCTSNCGGGGGGGGTSGFQGNAVYDQGVVSATNGNSSTATTINLPITTADGRKSGTANFYRSTSVSPTETVGSTDGTKHEATTQSDDDDTTPGVTPGAWPSPNCTSGNWSDFTGGLAGANVISAGTSCSSVQYSDGFPYASSSVGITNGIPTLTATVPAGGVLGAFNVTAFAQSATSTATSIVDGNGASGTQTTIASTSSLGLGSTSMLGFNAGGFAATNGSVIFNPATYSATASAGIGAAAPTTSGIFTFQLYDPNAALTICASRTGTYCNVSVNATVAGFAGSNLSATVTLSVRVLTVEVARITIVTNIVVAPPTKSVNSSGGNTNYAKVVFPMPRIASTMTVQAPMSTTLATISDDIDFGELVSVASYQP